MKDIYSVVFDKDTTVAIFFTLDQAKDYVKWQYNDTSRRFRLRVFGGDTCYYDTKDNG